MRVLTILLLAAFVFFTCGKKDKKPKETEEPGPTVMELLDKKAELYASLSLSALDANGFVKKKCDSLLFTSLYCVGMGNRCKTNLYQAEGEFGTVNTPGLQAQTGQWFRTPGHNCLVEKSEAEKLLEAEVVEDPLERSDWVENGSKSSISRDMFSGLWSYLWEVQDGAAIERIVAFGKVQDPKWYMGQAVNRTTREQRTNLRAPMIGTLFMLLYKLTGEDDSRRKNPQFWSPISTGSDTHVQVLHLETRLKMFGAASQYEVDYLKLHKERQPNNAYFQALYHRYKDGDQSAAVDILMNERYFPNDRLPTSADRCEGYLWGRDEDSSDWEPCPEENMVHSGADFLYVYRLIKGDSFPWR